MNEIKQISDLLLLSLNKKRFNNEIYEKLKGVDSCDFLQYVFLNYPELAAHEALILYNKILYNLSFDQWISLLKGVSNSEIALYSFIGFTSRFLGIEFLHFYIDMKGVNKLIVQNVKSYFDRREPLLYPSEWDIKQVKSLNESVSSFREIHEKLVKSGALPIEKKLLWEI